MTQWHLSLRECRDCTVVSTRVSRFFIFLVLAFLVAPVSASAQDITRQLHRPMGQSSLENARDYRDYADTLLRVGERQYNSGTADKAVESWLQALAIYHRLSDINAQGLVYDSLGKGYVKLGLFKEAEDAFRRRLGIARDTKNFQAQIFALNNIGSILLQKGEADAAALRTFEEAFEISRNVSNLEGKGLSLSNMGLAAARLGDYNRAIKLYEIALNYRRQVRDPIGEANTLNNLGEAYQGAGDYQNTIGTYGAALRIAKATRDRTNELRAIDGLVSAHSSVGRYPRAFELLEQRLVVAQQLQNRREELRSFEYYAQLYEKLGKLPTASNFYERAIAIARTLEDSKKEVLLLDRLTQIQRRK